MPAVEHFDEYIQGHAHFWKIVNILNEKIFSSRLPVESEWEG